MFSNAEAIYFSFEFDVVCENSRCLVVVVTLLRNESVYVYEMTMRVIECICELVCAHSSTICAVCMIYDASALVLISRYFAAVPSLY